MTNSECRTQECPLADLPRDVPAVVVRVPIGIGALGWHGVRPGALLTVAADAPLGGPRIVRLDGSRLAIGRTLTRAIVVRPVGRPGQPVDGTPS
jgi:Fe2+ transport system protein FeoA